MPSRAYLRLDPQLRRKKGHYPDGALAAFVLVLCAADGQPRRGRFESVAVLRAFLGVKRARWIRFLLDKHDLVPSKQHRCPHCPSGDPDQNELYVDGWDEWQEGDVTVQERVARLRAKRAGVTAEVTPDVTGDVTPPVTPDRRAHAQPAEAKALAEAEAAGRIRPPTMRIPTDQDRAEARAAAQSVLDNPDSHPAARAAAQKAIVKLNGAPAPELPPDQDVDFGAPPPESDSAGEQAAPDA